jgi:hypothetical protein
MISIFKYCKEPKAKPIRNLSEQEFFDGIKNGQWQDEVLDYRTNKIEKTKLHCLTPSGVFSQREIKGLVEHSNVICLDVDAKDQICSFNIDDIKKDEYVYVSHESCTGNGGYAIYVKIDGNKHLEAYLGLEEYFFVNYSIVLDKACKDVSRLRFVSFDPFLHQNSKSKVFKKYLKKKEVEKKNYKTIVVKSDFDEMVNQASSMNLFDDYNDYVSLCFALVSEFGEDGRNYFHSLCGSSSKYNYEKADKHYSQAQKREQTGITISSVYFKFKEAGIRLTSEKTEQIKAIAKLSDNPKEILKELNIRDEENLVDKFKEKEDGEKTEIDLIVDLIKLSKIRFNEVTRYFEIGKDKMEMTDRVLAKFYTQVWTKIDDKISKDKIFTLIQNIDNSESYNPIHEWFERNKHIEAKGIFDELIQCFEIESVIYEEKEKLNVTDYLDVYLKKWLLGLIGSAHGTYSLMILVLSGEQGIKKTEFFRNLFPEELSSLYTESNLDEGKDSEILMTKKWLIMDDEFGGKSKKDATKLKRLSSQQKFSIRMHYGRFSEDLTRLAVLGGTSNDYEVINDPTGNRRIIPINLISFDFDRYKKIDKTKLFIELYKEWEQDKTAWFLTKGEIEYLNKSTTKNIEIMSEVELLDRNLRPDIYTKMTNTDIKLELEKMFPSLRTTTKRIGQALKICGYEQKIQKVNGKTMRFYECIFN